MVGGPDSAGKAGTQPAWQRNPDRTPIAQGSSYAVVAGDTLGDIAARANVSLERLKEENPDLRRFANNFNLIFAKVDKVRIPSGEGGSAQTRGRFLASTTQGNVEMGVRNSDGILTLHVSGPQKNDNFYAQLSPQGGIEIGSGPVVMGPGSKPSARPASTEELKALKAALAKMSPDWSPEGKKQAAVMDVYAKHIDAQLQGKPRALSPEERSRLDPEKAGIPTFFGAPVDMRVVRNIDAKLPVAVLVNKYVGIRGGSGNLLQQETQSVLEALKNKPRAELQAARDAIARNPSQTEECGILDQLLRNEPVL